MTREEMILHYQNFIKFERLTNQEVVVGAGGAMLMLGLREETHDIDIDLPENIFHRIVIKHGITGERIISPTSSIIAKYDALIDLHKSAGEPTMVIEGVRIWKPHYILQFKEKLNRDKDQKDISVLRIYLGIHPNKITI